MRRAILESIGLIALAAASRLLPHPPNMTAVSAVAYKARARFGVWGVAIPVAAMLLSDIVIGLYDWKVLVSVYASFALIGGFGALLDRASMRRLIAIPALGAIVFFLITNAVVWASSVWYPHTVQGLLACYAAGLPFLIPMVLGDIACTVAVFRLPQPIPRASEIGGDARIVSGI